MTQANNFKIKGPVGQLAVRTKGFDTKPRQIVILVQGANVSGQTGYDFSFPGSTDYSTMDAMVAAGFGAVTFAVRSYHLSDHAPEPLKVDTNAAIEDLGAVLDWASTQGYPTPHLLGWSWGGRIVGRFAERNAARVDRLVLLDPALGGGNKIPPIPTALYRDNTAEDYLKRMSSEHTDDDARHAFAKLVVSQDPRAPNGILMENAVGSTPVNPIAITRPILMIYGSDAGKQNYMQGSEPRGLFFDRLATPDRSLVIVAGGGDYAHIQRPRKRVQAEIVHFLRST